MTNPNETFDDEFVIAEEFHELKDGEPATGEYIGMKAYQSTNKETGERVSLPQIGLKQDDGRILKINVSPHFAVEVSGYAVGTRMRIMLDGTTKLDGGRKANKYVLMVPRSAVSSVENGYSNPQKAINRIQSGTSRAAISSAPVETDTEVVD